MPGSKEIVGILRGAHSNTVNYVIPIRANEPTSIGSLPQYDFQIRDPRVSYLHAVIYTVKYDDDDRAGIHVPFIQDLSDNGTYLNHQPIGRNRAAALFQGCIISFATSDFEFYYIPKTPFNSAQYAYSDVTPATEMEEFIPNNGITTDNQDHDSQQAKDNIIIRLTDLIAAGGEGSVYLAIPLKAQILPVACKIRDSRYGRHSPVRIQEEIEIMRYCQHVGILPLLGIHRPDPKRDCWYLLTPLATGGNLERKIKIWKETVKDAEAIKDPNNRDVLLVRCISTIRCIFYQLAMAVYYLHSPYFDSRGRKAKRVIIHADIKPSNILIYDNANYPWVILGDFGSAFFKEKANIRLTEGGTLPYWAPELFKMRQEDFVIEEPEKIDIWALGLILYEMIGYCHPFVHKDTPKDRTYEDIRDNQLKFDGSLWSDVGQEVKDLIQWCLKKDPRERPTISELLGFGQLNLPDERRRVHHWIHDGQDMARFGEFAARFRAEKLIWAGQWHNADASSQSTEHEGEETKTYDGQVDNLYFKNSFSNHEKQIIVEMTQKEKQVRPGRFPNNRWMLEVLDEKQSSNS